MKTIEEINVLALKYISENYDTEILCANEYEYLEKGFIDGYNQAAISDDWINVKDRLPEHNTEVLINFNSTDRTDVIKIGHYNPIQKLWYCSVAWEDEYITVLSWKPIMPPKK